jgi:hypothetical protein
VGWFAQCDHSQYGWYPVYPHSSRRAFSNRYRKWRCQAKKEPVPWMVRVLMMCVAVKSSNRDRAPGARRGSIVEGKRARHLTALMYDLRVGISSVLLWNEGVGCQWQPILFSELDGRAYVPLFADCEIMTGAGTLVGQPAPGD